MKRVLAITGIRSEYDILYPVLNELNKNRDIELGLVVSNAHLSDQHGLTLKNIENDGFKIVDKIDCLFNTDRKTQRAKGVGMLIYGLSQTVDRFMPDLIMVIGDREESIASAIVGNYMDVPVMHIGGGDPVYGNADDPIRMGVSKIAHIHITTAQDYANNLINMGEEPFRVFNLGNPSLDNIRNTQKISIKKISDFLGLNIVKNKYFIFLKHPLSSELNETEHQMKIALDAALSFCKKFNFKLIGIFPNTDPGSHKIINIIESFSTKNEINFFKTLPRDIFINLLRNACFIAGNSSMGILEAPFYKLPAVNIGSRQQGRLNAGNLEFVDHDKKKIITSMEKAAFNLEYRKKIKKLKNPYGDGFSSIKIANLINELDIDNPKWLVKEKLI
ncbi:UDP-N-acetylglucosamine 2-epimerase [Gammaproteobacteria bacterium]|nr:UDP-N-acetylglucosamine 2-epimerase [Gammaproteobacteria bacterium]